MEFFFIKGTEKIQEYRKDLIFVVAAYTESRSCPNECRICIALQVNQNNNVILIICLKKMNPMGKKLSQFNSCFCACCKNVCD